VWQHTFAVQARLHEICCSGSTTKPFRGTNVCLSRRPHLPDNLKAARVKSDAISYPPRGLSRDEAARYVGVGSTLFEEMVADGRMPRPKHINSRTIWDRVALDIAFTSLPDKDSGLQELLERSKRDGGKR
jgi:predicted DNA-binding transcriptional regulator AlpA